MTHRFPPAFEERMSRDLQQDWELFAHAHKEEVPISIRVNPLKKVAVGDFPVPWARDGRYLLQRPVFTLDPRFHAGAYYVQEASSMILEQALDQSVDLQKPLRVLDLCAAPGGKSTHLLSLLSQDSLLVSNEAIRSRASVLGENIIKWGYPNVVVTNNDPADAGRLTGFFDVIVVDAPCSGEGLFRKDAHAMTEWSTANVSLCAARQRRILADVWPALKEGGVLIYCTCTYSEEENETNLAWLSNQQDLEFIDIRVQPEWGIQKTSKSNIPGLRLMPHLVMGEGFFMASVRKLTAEKENRIKIRNQLKMATAKQSETLKPWFIAPERLQLIAHDDLLIIIPSHAINDFETIGEQLKVVQRGTAIGTIKHDKVVPEHASALSISLNKSNFPMLPLDNANALSYLRKENLSVTSSDRGFALAMFEDLPLGWVNLLGNRINNLYPPAWRIRMGS